MQVGLGLSLFFLLCKNLSYVVNCPTKPSHQSSVQCTLVLFLYQYFSFCPFLRFTRLFSTPYYIFTASVLLSCLAPQYPCFKPSIVNGLQYLHLPCSRDVPPTNLSCRHSRFAHIQYIYAAVVLSNLNPRFFS